MWVQKQGKKYRLFERYKNYHTGEIKVLSTTMEKNTANARKDAIARLNKRASSFNKPRDQIAFGDLCKLYLEDCELTLKKATCKRNSCAADKLIGLFGYYTPLTRLDAPFIREKLLKSGKPYLTINEYLRRLKAMLRWAYRNDFVPSVEFLNKLPPFRTTSKKDRIADKFLEKEEVERLLEMVTDHKYNLAIRFLVLTGLRFGELAALKRSDVDLETRLITVRESYNGVVKEFSAPKTASSVREIYIQEELLPVVKEILDWSSNYNTDLFLPTENGKVLDIYAFNRYLKRRDIGKNLSSHIFRHTHCSLLAEQGVPLEVISRRLGHSNSKITKEVYFHVTNNLKKQDYKIIEQIGLIS